MNNKVGVVVVVVVVGLGGVFRQQRSDDILY